MHSADVTIRLLSKGNRLPFAQLGVAARTENLESSRSPRARVWFQTVHTWHPHIEDEARRFLDAARLQKFLGRRESLGSEAERADEPLRRPPRRGAVIHNRDEKTFNRALITFHAASA